MNQPLDNSAYNKSVLDLVSRPEFWIGVLVAGALVVVMYIVVRMAVADELESREPWKRR